jgi:hypothetical protein
VKARTFTCEGETRGSCGCVHRKFDAALACIGRDIRETTRLGAVISDRMPVATDGTSLTEDERAKFQQWESSPW